MRKILNDIDVYIARAPKEVRTNLRKVRAAIMGVAPSPVESTGYQMPYYAFKGDLSWSKSSIVWFGLQSRHIGLYLPPPT